MYKKIFLTVDGSSDKNIFRPIKMTNNLYLKGKLNTRLRLKLWDLELLPVLAANPIKYSSLFVRINLKSWRYVSNLIHISTCHLTGNSIDRPKYITFCHS